MRTIIDAVIELLCADERVSDHKVNTHRKDNLAGECTFEKFII